MFIRNVVANQCEGLSDILHPLWQYTVIPWETSTTQIDNLSWLLPLTIQCFAILVFFNATESSANRFAASASKLSRVSHIN